MGSADKPAINPYLVVLIGVLAAGFSSIFTKLAEAPPLIIAFYRLGFTILILAIPTYMTGRAEIRGVTKRDFLLAALSGTLLALHFAVWISSLNYTSIASSTVLVTMHPLFVITGGYIFYREGIGKTMTWVWFTCLAIIPTIFGHSLFNWALKYVKAAVVSVSILGEPIGATLLALLIFGEVPTALQLTGGLVILAGLYIFITSQKELGQKILLKENEQGSLKT